MAKKQDKPWQYKVTTTLTAVTLLLVLGYFVQSFIEIRKVKPVSVAIERLKDTRAEPPTIPVTDETSAIKESSPVGQ